MANGAPSDHGAGPEQAPPAAAAAIAAAAAAKSAGSPSGRRAPREINWLNLWPIAFAPLIPAVVRTSASTRASTRARAQHGAAVGGRAAPGRGARWGGVPGAVQGATGCAPAAAGAGARQSKWVHFCVQRTHLRAHAAERALPHIHLGGCVGGCCLCPRARSLPSRPFPRVSLRSAARTDDCARGASSSQALATRKSPQLRTPLVGAISVGTLIFAHGFAMDASVSSKDG